MVKNKIIFTVIIIFVVALLPRLFLAFSSCEIPTYDALGYDERAVSLLEGKGFSQGGVSSSYREPLYSFFLAFIYWLFGHNYTVARIIQSILGALTCIFIFLISRKLFDYRTALISGFIACFNPSFIKITEHLLSENLYTFLLVIATYFFVRQIQEKDYKNLVFLGLILGLAALTRAVIFFFPLFIIFMGKSLVDRHYSLKKHILSILILIFFFVLPIAPWTLRNWRVHHRFIPIISRTGGGLYCSYVPKDGKLFGFNADDETTRKAELIESEAERDAFLLRETLKYIINNPLRILKLEVLKVAYFWSPFDWEVIGYGVYNFMFGFIFPFFIYAIFVTRRRIRELLPVYLPIIYSFLLALVTYGSPRFRLPIEPFLIILASAGITHFLLTFSKRIYGIFAIGGFLLFNLYLFCNSFQAKIFVRFIFKKIRLW